jgi:hypothetical protein
MSRPVLPDPLVQSERRLTQQEQANLALGRILDAEIDALKARLWQRSADAAVVWGLARADLDRQVSWLRDSLAKVQARRDALC